MGCDIHFYVERREGDRWVPCDTWIDLYPVTDGVAADAGDNFYDDRNYDMFAMLADVRNGFGTAGIDRGDGFNVIAAPRGVPGDMCEELADRWSVDEEACHTPTWLLLSELLAFDWSQVSVRRGYVRSEVYDQWSRTDRAQKFEPRESAGLVFPGDSLKVITEAEMIAAIDAIRAKTTAEDFATRLADELAETYCQVTWDVSYANAAGGFFTDTVPALQRLGAPDQVRCVFWFDN
jgi:hypothetical protein